MEHERGKPLPPRRMIDNNAGFPRLL